MLSLFRDVCVLRIGVLGINFKTAPLELREAIARGAEVLAGEKGIFFPHPTVLLSTCNRTEIYFSGEDLPSVHSHILAILRSYISDSFEHRLYSYFGIDCFAHLCRVAAGLDSAILAETEIQRQVKVAYHETAQRGILSPCIHYAFQKALKVGKMVRTQLALERGAPSLHSTIWTLSEEFWGTLTSRRVLFVGYSELNRALSSFFLRRGVTQLTLATKDPSRVKHPGCEVIGREGLELWEQFHIVICASKAGHYLIRKVHSPQAETLNLDSAKQNKVQAQRLERRGPFSEGRGKGDVAPSPNSKFRLEGSTNSSRRLLFDLSVPRNIDPSLSKISQLYNIEQLDRLIERRRRAQGSDLERCEEFVRQTVLHLARIYRDKRSAPMAQILR